MSSAVPTLSLVPADVVLKAANSSNTTTSSSTGGAEQLNMNWKTGSFMGMLLLSPIVLGLGL
ncbi:unnamed protein product [Cyberlindnera jadinii]|uniref:Uncharacterized protein n=1 Tax=Cyberlindnera jadinii (strain ATCC 18201 / CBS 1600 / BCRC 20928 / JCM 3617 / NBRC 0987 / NRRL Y-1542) TaxID=983966 RepID=A0A0H5CBN3_CYBJN|nr:unnamed protein product [Cyberlindnera jadinii]